MTLYQIGSDPTPVKRLAAYVRVSDEKQTVENQKIAIENYVKVRPDLVIVEWFDKDEGVSAFRERPDFNRMKKKIAMHQFDGVIAYKLDRIGRSVIDLRNSIDFFKDHDCDVIFVADSIDTTTPQGRLFFTIQSAFAEYEAEMIRERTRLGLERVRLNGSKSGKLIGCPLNPYIDDKKIVELYDEGCGYQRIANELGYSKSTVKYRLKKMGKLRSRGIEAK